MIKTLFRTSFVGRLCHQCKRNCSWTTIPVNDPCTAISTLPNGVRVATEATCTPLTCISLFVEAGPRYEVSCNNGISHLIEHLAFKGFKAINYETLETSLQAMGTKLSSKTTRELQYFSARTLPEFTPNVIDFLSRIITDLDITDKKIEDAKYNMCLEMVDSDNDPKAVVFDYLHQTAFQGTNLAQTVIGPSKNTRTFTTEFCQGFLRDHYQPYKLCLSAAGAVKHEHIVLYANKCLGAVPVLPVCVSEEGPSRYTGSSVIYRDDSMPFVHAAIALEVPGYGNIDSLPLLIACNFLGSWHKSQGRGMNNGSPLARAAATSHLCEQFEAFYLPYRDVGLWGVYFVSDKMSVEDMVYNIQQEWMYICTMLQHSDIQRAANATKIKISQSRAGAINACLDIGMQAMYTCNRSSIADLFTEMNCAKNDVIRNICEKYIYDRCPVVAAVGPTEAFPDYNRVRSGMYWIRL